MAAGGKEASRLWRGKKCKNDSFIFSFLSFLLIDFFFFAAYIWKYISRRITPFFLFKKKKEKKKQINKYCFSFFAKKKKSFQQSESGFLSLWMEISHIREGLVVQIGGWCTLSFSSCKGYTTLTGSRSSDHAVTFHVLAEKWWDGETFSASSRIERPEE